MCGLRSVRVYHKNMVGGEMREVKTKTRERGKNKNSRKKAPFRDHTHTSLPTPLLPVAVSDDHSRVCAGGACGVRSVLVKNIVGERKGQKSFNKSEREGATNADDSTEHTQTHTYAHTQNTHKHSHTIPPLPAAAHDHHHSQRVCRWCAGT